MLTRMGRWALRVSSTAAPWTNVYGLARSLLAFGTALTLAFNDSSILFPLVAGAEPPPYCNGLRGAGAFCLMSHDLDAGRWLLVAALVVIASGWRPRYTALLHWWISWSVQANAGMVEGGDQVTAIITLLLLPIALTDQRSWHWLASAVPAVQPPGPARATIPLLALSAQLAIRLQVAAIYFDSVVGKLGVAEWKDGTALYYWLTHPTFGAPSWLRPALVPLLTSTAVAPLTWSVILVEIALFMGLTMNKRYRGWLLVAGLFLHGGIMVVHGLVSFGLAMFGALILFLRPSERPFDVSWLTKQPAAWARCKPWAHSLAKP